MSEREMTAVPCQWLRTRSRGAVIWVAIPDSAFALAILLLLKAVSFGGVGVKQIGDFAPTGDSKTISSAAVDCERNVHQDKT